MSANPSPALAALLSFIFPGVGQIYAGQTRKGIVWAIPMLIFVLAVIGILLAGQTAMLNLVNSPQKRLALLIFNVAFFLYHLAATIDAYAVAQRARERSFGHSSVAPIVLACLVSLTLVMHGLPEVYGYQTHETMTAVLDNDADEVIPRFSPVPTTPGLATPSVEPTPSPSPTATPTPSVAPGTSDPTGPAGPTATPGKATPAPKVCPPPVDLASWPAWADDGKLNILVVGTDSRSDEGVGAKSLRTDTMLLLSVDIQDCKAAIFSFPRNLCSAVQGDCGIGTRYPDWLSIPLDSEVLANPAAQAAFPSGSYGGVAGAGWNYLNSLWRYAALHPEMFPGSEGIDGRECSQQFECIRGWRALVGSIQEMTGVQIDGIVAINLKGFVGLVENLPPLCPPRDARAALTNAECYGGVWIDVPRAVHDDDYNNSQQQKMVVDIAKGCQYFDGEMALAYARSRHESSDYDRARRQQYVLTQVRKQLDPLSLLPRVPALLQVVQQNMFMTFGDGDIAYLAEAASRIDGDRMYRYDFAPNKVAALGSMQGVREKVNNIFDEPEPEPEPKTVQSPCPPRT